MVFAVLELRDLEGDFLGLGLGVAPDRLQFAANPLVALHLVDKDLGGFRVHVEMGDHRILDCIDDAGTNLGVTELVLGLGFEHRFLHLDGEDADDPVADIVAIVFFAGEFVDAFIEGLWRGSRAVRD